MGLVIRFFDSGKVWFNCGLTLVELLLTIKPVCIIYYPSHLGCDCYSTAALYEVKLGRMFADGVNGLMV